MVSVHRGSNWKIALYAREHRIPHFHIEGPEFRCSVGIASLDVIIGNVAANVLAEACSLVRRNRNLLTAKWLELNP
jgi:hypothetical protein